MKKLIAILLALTLSLCACGAGPKGAADSSVPEESSPPPESSASQASSEPAPSSYPSPYPSAYPSPSLTVKEVGQTADEIREAVEIEIDDELLERYSSVPEDIAGIIYASASQWMKYAFTDQAASEQAPPPLESYACTRLKLYDVSEDEQVFCYSLWCEYKPVEDEDWMYWQPGNTTEADREGWYKFSRQLAVVRDGEAWEVVSVGTGGVSVEDYLDRAGDIS